MFRPVKAPKGGRSPPGLLPYAGPQHSSRRRSWTRKATIILVWAVCFLVGFWLLSSGDGTVSSMPTTFSTSKLKSGPKNNAILNEKKPDTPADPDVHEAQIDKPPNHVHQQPINSPSTEEVPKTEQQINEDDSVATKIISSKNEKPQSDERKPQSKPAKSGLAPAREKWSKRPEFDMALTKVLSLLPDEMHARELTRPVEVSGKGRMREMGLRTRAYKMYLDAWEALHTTTDEEGTTFIRDDVVAYLRSQQQVIGTDESDDERARGEELATTIRQYETYRSFLQKFAELLFPWTMPYYSDHMSLHASFRKGGRGIVLTAGDDQAPYLLTTIWSFRQLGCTLPIEVMYLGDEDLAEDYRALLEALPGVVTRDIAQMTDDTGWKLAGWAAKPFAILLSSFREVIFIDADSLFFKNPEVLFDDPDYKKTGALFFKDRLMSRESKKRWLQQVLPKPIPRAAKETRLWTGESGHMQESGVVVVDKWRHFHAMLLITRFNGPDRDGDSANGITGVYDMMYGDKETFWIGFLLAGDESFAFHRGDAGVMGEFVNDKSEKLEEQEDSDKDTEPQFNISRESIPEDEVDNQEHGNFTICASQLLHLDTEGRPLWFNGWLLKDKFAENSKKRFTSFEGFLREPSKMREPSSWELGESNVCCLTVEPERKYEFTSKENEILNMIIGRAAEMGMGDQH